MQKSSFLRGPFFVPTILTFDYGRYGFLNADCYIDYGCYHGLRPVPVLDRLFLFSPLQLEVFDLSRLKNSFSLICFCGHPQIVHFPLKSNTHILFSYNHIS